MTQEQFYYCLNRILELRDKINETCNVRRRAQVTESTMYEGQQVDFDSLRRYAENKENADRNTAEAHALIKELAAQEAKIRVFVPVSFYGSKIMASQPGKPPLYVVVEPKNIDIEKCA
ncbi:hypothetical protein [Pontibacter anaerobius]|uniref:Uncharacterized protein n=1 Tax=Pontibacter anaerobius TaxID=2993940 RepID=A0ABT3RHE9_9BACT|nr:hypothetical protein [Pontibacter anaerobius]MCX2740871.1 hypothetical protein [Pontibacter anaerobius]